MDLWWVITKLKAKYSSLQSVMLPRSSQPRPRKFTSTSRNT